MEKLLIGLILLLSAQLSLNAQTIKELYVFDVKGTIINKNKEHTYLKGDLITVEDTLLVTKDASIIAIDSNGLAYKKNLTGNYSFDELLKGKQNLSNLTIRYFHFLYQEFIGSKSGQTVMAGVIRGTDLLIQPPDSSIVSRNHLLFSWDKANTNFYYFFLRNLDTGDIFKMGTNGLVLRLYAEMPIFEGASRLEWTVDTREYPDLNNIGWNEFVIVDRHHIGQLLALNQQFILDLVNLGLNDSDISYNLCVYKGICD